MQKSEAEKIKMWHVKGLNLVST